MKVADQLPDIKSRLQEAYQRHPLSDYLHRNSEKAEAMTQMLSQSTGRVAGRLKFLRANEFLNAGQTKHALSELEQIAALIEKQGG